MRGQDSVEVRRERGEIACKECRRLKLKCDKSIPCGSCRKRGCAELCPNRAQITVHGSKGASAELERLQAKIKAMTKKMRQYEQALASAHIASSSIEPHPLLVSSTTGKEADDMEDSYTQGDSDSETNQGKSKNTETLLDRSILDSFSKLTITDNRQNVENVLDVPEGLSNVVNSSGIVREANLETSLPLALPVEVVRLYELFPLASHYGSGHQLQDMIHSLLPRYERATALVEAYIENLSWSFNPIGREQIMEELIPTAYRNSIKYLKASSNVPTRMDPHDLALLLAVMAIGAASDLTQPPFNTEGETYRFYCLAALSLKSIFDHTTLACVQAISIIANYELYACRPSSPSGSYKMMNLSCTLALQLGLHRDPGHANFSEKVVQRRRMLLWELYSADCQNSFVSGRPNIFKSSSIDCAFPDDPFKLAPDNGDSSHSFWHWRTRFVRDVVSVVMEKLNSAQNLKYSEILALDQRVRAFDPFDRPGQSTPVTNSAEAEGSVIWYLHRYADTLMKGITLGLLHRNFFARAILERPDDPVKSVFAPSFLAAYHNAVSILRIVREHYGNVAHLLMRIWPVWAHLLADTVVVGSIAALGSKSSLAQEAFVEFDIAIGLFAKAQMHPVAKDGLPVLLRLRDRAFRALTNDGENVAGVVSASFQGNRSSILPEQPLARTDDFNVVNALGRVYWRGKKGDSGVPSLNEQRVMSSYTEPAAMSVPGPSTASEIPNNTSGAAHSIGKNMEVSTVSSEPASLPLSPLSSSIKHMFPDSALQTSHPQTTNAFESHGGPSLSSAFSALGGYAQTPEAAGPSTPYEVQASYLGRGDMNDSGSTSHVSVAPSAVDFIPDVNLGAQPMMCDFDVSHDLRLGTGAENPLAMLPQDMEAWRAIMEDPRMLGQRDYYYGVD